MKTQPWIGLLVLTAVGIFGCQPTDRPGSGSGSGSTVTDAVDVAPDNTGINRRDASGATLTPLDQSNEAEDRETTAEVRRRVVDLDDVSVSGRNVKIITTGGQVTLRGPVASDAEREQIEKIARDVAGEENVSSELEVITP